MHFAETVSTNSAGFRSVIESRKAQVETTLSEAQETARKPRRRAAPQNPTTRSSNSVQNLYSWIRSAILNGKFAAGEAINQAQLAVQFGVSRTPLREALRMLQAEGLLVGEINQRMRVARLTPEDIVSLYAARIVLETLRL